MDVLEHLNAERHRQQQAQTLRSARQKAVAGGQETLGLRARSLAAQITQQGPIVAQTLTWAQGLCGLSGSEARQEAKAYLQALVASRTPQASQDTHSFDQSPQPLAEPPKPDHAAITSFLAHIAHELRTPLTGVAGMADLLCDSPLTPEQRDFAQSIKSSATAALVITQDILDYAKIKTDGVRLLNEPFDLKQVILDVTTMIQPAARAKGISLRVDIDPDLPLLIGDSGRVRQVLTNLVGNAIKFTGQGHVLVRIVGLNADQDPHQVEITVEDTGIGIAAGEIEAIFDAFHQATPNDGLGLGLAVAKRLVEAMGGAVWVDSERGKGATFGLRLPLPVAKVSAPLASLTPNLPSVAPQNQPTAPLTLSPRPMRILVAEDNRTSQLVFQKMLRDLAVEVVFASNGGEAVDLFQNFHPDLIFMDIAMPQMDGVQATHTIRQMAAGDTRLPIIALTAQAAEEGRSPFLDAGFDRHLTKPLQKATLHEVMFTYCPKGAYVTLPEGKDNSESA